MGNDQTRSRNDSIFDTLPGDINVERNLRTWRMVLKESKREGASWKMHHRGHKEKLENEWHSGGVNTESISGGSSAKDMQEAGEDVISVEEKFQRERDNLNREDFWIRNQSSCAIVRFPGVSGLYGQQLVIEECNDCDFYLCDYSGGITIDNCTNCRFFIGPVAGSVFVRTSRDCNISVCCQQFRTRECSNIDVLLLTKTGPVIEDTKNIRFGCFDYFYLGLKDHLNAASLSIFNNEWSSVFDFTPGASNFSYLEPSVRTWSILRPLHQVSNVISAEEEEFNKHTLLIPITHGNREPSLPRHKYATIVFFPGFAEDAIQFLLLLRVRYPGIITYKTKEREFNKKDATSLWAASTNKSVGTSTDVMRKRVREGKSVIIAINGDSAVTAAKRVAAEVTKKPNAYFVPTSDNEIHYMRRIVFEELKS